MEKRIFLFSGPSGGKSTFIGGLLQHVYSRDDCVVTYDVALTSVNTFEEEIMESMMSSNEYPRPTESPYIAKINLKFRSVYRNDVDIRVVDFPGKWIERGTDLESIHADTVRTTYTESGGVRSKIENDQPLSDEERQVFLKYHLSKSDRIIFLINLQKILSGKFDASVIYDLNFIRSLTDLEACAVVPIGVDLVNYSSTGLEQPGMLRALGSRIRSRTPHMVDKELLSNIKEKVPKNLSFQAHNILRGIKLDPEAAFFGVAVPPSNKKQVVDPKQQTDNTGYDEESTMPNNLIAENDGFEIQGFGQVLSWLRSFSGVL